MESDRRPDVSALRDPPQMHRGGLLLFKASAACLVRRTTPSQILRVKRAQRSRDSRTDPHNAVFHAWPKQGNPEIAAKKQLRTSYRGWAFRADGAIMVQLLDGLCWMVHDPARRGSITVFVHSRLKSAIWRDWM